MRPGTRRALGLSVGLIVFWHQAAMALEWEIERNFRYFLYPSDVAVQRVARDIAMAESSAGCRTAADADAIKANCVLPTPEDMEHLLNDASFFFAKHADAATVEASDPKLKTEGFWGLPLAKAGALKERWPIAWAEGDPVTVYDLVKRLREKEGRSLKVERAELSRLGWATLLAEGRDRLRPTGYTATCWDPGKRLHSNCAIWGDYVRPPGWIVRIFDPQAPAGQQCMWSFDGAVVADGTIPARFERTAQQALQSKGKPPVAGDCREIRLIVPSDPNEPKTVAARVSVTRTSTDGALPPTSVVVKPKDRLIIGFGDSVTSGEGNPERPAIFTGKPWTSGRFGGVTGPSLPQRADDPTTLAGSDSRAQWTDRWCHRSVYSAQIRAALAASLADLQQSVTVLHYGCSGATITEGMLGEYDGVEWSAASDHNIIGSRVEIGAAYQEMCQPQTFRSPYCRRSSWCGPTAKPTARQEAAAGFYDREVDAVRRSIARCGTANAVKRSADALILDIGANDVEFQSWAAAMLVDDPILLWIANGFVPCVDNDRSCAATHAATMALFNRLDRRYGVLRQVLDRFLLPDFGIDDPSHVIVPVYPPGALESEDGQYCPLSNGGLTAATFPSFRNFILGPDASACQGAMRGVALGVITAYRGGANVMHELEAARVKVNDKLGAFAFRPGHDFDVVNFFTPDFDARGLCATTDLASRSPAASACFTVLDLANADVVRCAPGDPPSNPESLHLPRTTDRFESCLPNNGDPSFFHPFPPGRFEPYRHRTRLWRTQNDTFMTVNQRADGWIDHSAYGTLDLTGRTTGGAIHPTAEALAIIANETTKDLCDAIGCGH